MKANHAQMLFTCLMWCGILSSVALSAALSDDPDSALKTTISTTTTTSTFSTTGDVTPPREFPINDSIGADTLPPKEFPEDQSRVNETAVKILLNNSTDDANNTKIDNKSSTELSVNGTSSTTELSPASSSNSNEQSSNSSTVASTTETFLDDYDNLSNEGEKNDVENIQDDSQESQESSNELEEQFARSNNSSGQEETIKVYQDVDQHQNIQNGHIALIFATTLVVLAVVAYAGLILWRSHLEKRYGMRQRLVTDDVFYSDNQNDVRYFGL